MNLDKLVFTNHLIYFNVNFRSCDSVDNNIPIVLNYEEYGIVDQQDNQTDDTF